MVVMELPTKRHGGRFVALPGGAGTEADPHLVLFLDDVVRAGAASLFPAFGAGAGQFHQAEPRCRAGH
ncbi:MAG: hypothetical protein WKG07_25285 [Hymenobacter sp.]